MIKTSIFKNKYKSLKLDDVSHALIGKGKIAGISGENAYTKSIEEQKQYVLRDSELVMDLSKFGNNEILDLMLAISELTGLSLEEVCHSSISRWWSKVFENMGLFEASSSSPPISITNNHENIQDKEQQEYEGGKVINSRKGVYHDLKIVDVVSLYPSMAILNNISFDTVNCVCCSDREDAKVLPQVIDKGYWICKQKDGAFPIKLREFKAERLRQKQLGNNTKQQGLKILINGGYGLFGNEGFRYADIRVAELITAYGRYTLNQMQLIAASYGLDVIGGDTDSLFLQTNDDKSLTMFISECKEKLRIELEHDKTFAKAIFTKKKHYLGVTDKGHMVIKGMEGKKNDRPLWINTVFNQFVKDILTDADPLANLIKSIKQLEEDRVSINDLKISVRLSKDPSQYSVNNVQKKIGQMLQLKKDDVIYYFKSDNKDGITLDSNEISIKKYKVLLWNSVKDILEVAGYDIATIEEEFLIDHHNNTSNIQRLSEVASLR
jgi:DNA polymerase, archaea type